jgi:hypothetical protein
MLPIYRHSLRFFESLRAAGRPDLAALNAAIDGRLNVSYYYNRRAGLPPRAAWRGAWSDYRAYYVRTFET